MRKGHGFYVILLLLICFRHIVSSVKHPRMNFLPSTRGGSAPWVSSDEYASDNFTKDAKSIEESLGPTDAFSIAGDPGVYASSVNSEPITTPSPTNRRHASDLVHDLLDRSLCPASVDIRQLITQRANEYIDQLNDPQTKKLPDPKKLLHYLAPKIPAIKHSPDVALRIQSARSEIDPGLAACLIGVLGYFCELYDKERARRRKLGADSFDDGQKFEPFSLQLIKDRRFEQLVECISCGVNVKQRTEEYVKQSLDHEAKPDRIEDVLDAENAQETGGLSIRDASRAAWGLAILGVHEHNIIGEENIEDLLIALSLRIRELLLAKLQALRQDDLDWLEGGSTRDTLEELSKELAVDAASAAWSFACVRAWTGIRFAPLIEVCCSILCQDPFDLRRRAQEVETAISTGNIGSNDAVDRLALSEANEGQIIVREPMTVPPPESTGETKRSLIDLLSPNGLTDVLWAVALHGSSETVSQDETALSETASAFCRIVIEKILVWLKGDADRFGAPAEQEDNEAVFTSRTDIPQRAQDVESSLSVEIVDAASLLLSEKLAVKALEANTSSSNSINVENGLPVHGQNQIEARDDKSTDSVTADIDDRIESASLVRLDVAQLQAQMNENESPSQIFSKHDLCSIVWAVTELQDPLRNSVIEIIVNIFAMLGTMSLKVLSMSDLSNLAWGIAKKVSDDGFVEDGAVLLLSNSIASLAVCENMIDFEPERDANVVAYSLALKFHPPELSRLVWATVTIRTHSRLDSSHATEALQLLAQASLHAAANHLDVYGAEDVSRIVWGFLELCGSDAGILANNVEALGRSLATIESTLHQWETCSESSSKIDEAKQTTTQPLKFGSFFGKSSTALLDQRLEQESAEDSAEFPFLARRPKPLLKDLPVDPSTLCKLLCSLAKLRSVNHWMTGGERIMRTALRLLSSKNGRLLRDCPLFDLARLCGAIAETDMSISRERVSHFVRRLAHFLNELPTGYHTAIGPAESAKLLWSLGELGIKYNPMGTDQDTAHRRLELVSDVTFLLTRQFGELTDRRLAKLLRGLVTTHLAPHEMEYTKDVITQITERITAPYSPSLICDLTETISLLNEILRDISDTFSNEFSSTAPPENDLLVGGTNDNDRRVQLSSLLDATETLMLELSKSTIESLNSMDAAEMRRLLSVYALSPIRVDGVVDAMEKVVIDRRKALDEILSTRLEWEPVFQKARDIRRSWKGESDSGLASLSNAFKSFFGISSNNEIDESPIEIEGVDADLIHQIDALLRSLARIGRHHEKIAAASGISLDKCMEDLFQAALFELGRCSELIACYRRVDFASGLRKARLDKFLRRDMTKRILSRALP